MTSNKAVLGLLSNSRQAGLIAQQLQAIGFPGDDISVLFPDPTGRRDFAREHHPTAPAGAIAGVGSGPILAALRGAAVGGGVAALVGMGIPEVDAKQYEGTIEGGAILLSVHVDSSGEGARARRILEHGGAVEIVTIGEEPEEQAAA